MRDWRKALRSQPTYKIGNRTFTFRLPNHVVLVMGLLLILLILFYLFHPTPNFRDKYPGELTNSIDVVRYNSTYPLSSVILRQGHPTFRIAIIADMDTSSKSKTSGNTWVSYLKLGYLSHNRGSGVIDITWDSTEPVELSSHFALKGET